MVGALFNTLFYKPLYNGFIFFIDSFPFLDAGIVVVLFTFFVKLVLFPLSQKSIKTQLVMRKLEPEMQRIREKHRNDRQQQALKLIEVYKQHKLNPFSGLILIFIQAPILIALYWIFLKGGLPNVTNSLLYSFVDPPGSVNMQFLGLVDITHKSVVLAIVAALAQFIQIKLTMPHTTKSKGGRTFEQDFARMLQVQMKYIFPIIVFFIAYQYTAVIALYLITSSLFAIGQELYVKSKLAAPLSAKTQIV